ncbi:MAG TPA: CbtA family protein [Spongiibacteraceae bacterium]|nr:CbtA family protein [Spongiibacteraceae bacterium]
MFREILISAGVAGLLAALILTLLQAVLITPLILQAEVYEDAPATAHETVAQEAVVQEAGVQEAGMQEAATESTEHAHQHTDGHTHQHVESTHASAIAVTAESQHEHHHDADEWKPQDGLQRTLFTLASNIVMAFGYALLLTGVYIAWRRPSGAMQGLLFGLAGFTVFFAAPALGLLPELPGTAAAELATRQQWWVSTAIATAVGLALLFMQKNIVLRIIGLLVLVAPHIVGAPHPAVESSLAPTELQNHFRLATTLVNAVFWLLLGVISALALKKFSTSQHAR